MSIKDFLALQAFSLAYLVNCRYNEGETEGSSRFFPVRGPVPVKSTSKDPGIHYSTCVGYNTRSLLILCTSASGLLETSQEATISQGKQNLTKKDAPMQPKLLLREVNLRCAAPEIFQNRNGAQIN